jgi:gliding motility-associated protein GldE
VDPDPYLFFHIGTLLQASIVDSFLSWPWGLSLLFIVLLAISFMVSSAEVAFLTLNDTELETLRNDETPAADRVLRMIQSQQDAERLLATILISNNFVNVAAILIATFILREQVGEELILRITDTIQLDMMAFLEIGVITFLLLLFGEIVPKKYARLNRVKLAKVLVKPMQKVRWLTAPPAKWLTQGTDFISRRIEKKASEEDTSLEDLKSAIELAVPSAEAKEEREILKGIVSFGNTSAKSIMRARVDVKAIGLDDSFGSIIELINEHKFSRFPVYEESLDQVKGIIHIKALLPLLASHQAGTHVNWQNEISEAYFVPESKKIDDLLEELKQRRVHLAIVVDEYGGTAGIVTLEDIIEEIFGEILDESDAIDNIYRRIDDNQFIFEGRISLINFRKILELDELVFEDIRGDSDSLGGLILEINGKIPKTGEVVSYGKYDFHIEAANKYRIIRVKVVEREEEGS